MAECRFSPAKRFLADLTKHQGRYATLEISGTSKRMDHDLSFS